MTKSHHEPLEATRDHLWPSRLPGAASSYQEQPGATRKHQDPPGAIKNQVPTSASLPVCCVPRARSIGQTAEVSVTVIVDDSWVRLEPAPFAA